MQQDGQQYMTKMKMEVHILREDIVNSKTFQNILFFSVIDIINKHGLSTRPLDVRYPHRKIITSYWLTTFQITSTYSKCSTTNCYGLLTIALTTIKELVINFLYNKIYVHTEVNHLWSVKILLK